MREHGTEAVGCYWGNPLAYTAPGIATVYTFWGKMESTRLFGGLTQDLSNKFAAMDAIFGVEAMFPAPDLYHTDYFLCLGSDPSGSHLTAVSVPNAIEAIRGIRERGRRRHLREPRAVSARSRWDSAITCRSGPTPTPICSPRCSRRSAGSTVGTTIC